jgi:hypothetical protein
MGVNADTLADWRAGAPTVAKVVLSPGERRTTSVGPSAHIKPRGKVIALLGEVEPAGGTRYGCRCGGAQHAQQTAGACSPPTPARQHC